MSNDSVIQKKGLLSGETIVWLFVIAAAIISQWVYIQAGQQNLETHVAEIRDDLDEIRNDIEKNRQDQNDFLMFYSRQEAIEDAADQILRIEVEHLKENIKGSWDGIYR